MVESVNEQERLARLEAKVAALRAECASLRRWLRDVTVALLAWFGMGIFMSSGEPWVMALGVVVALLVMRGIGAMRSSAVRTGPSNKPLQRTVLRPAAERQQR